MRLAAAFFGTAKAVPLSNTDRLRDGPRWQQHDRREDGAPGFRCGPPVPTRSYDSSNVGHCMGERDEEASDVPGMLGNNFDNHDGKGFRPSPSQEDTYILPVHMR